MPFVPEAVAPNARSIDLDRVALTMGPPPWRLPLIASPLARWVLLEWPAGFRSSPHQHPRGPEIFHVLRGEARFGIGEHVESARAGTLLLAPPGVGHWIEVAGTEPLLFIASVSPNEDSLDETVELPVDAPDDGRAGG
jgi:quercetin dioxygenase-like cupin family protein